MSNYPLTSQEMSALSSVAQMSCIEAYKKAADSRKDCTIMALENQREIIKCWEKAHVDATDRCGDAYKALVECLYNNERRSLKCAHLRPILEECYVGKVILKQGK